jgi:hypothetical protein
MSIQISEDAKRILRTVGWHEGRRVETAAIRSFLRGRGFEVSSLADCFLSNFHGLRLRPLDGPLSFLAFDVYEEVGWIEEEDKPFLAALDPEPLCPIGHGGGVLLFLTPSGKMILLNDQWFTYRRIPKLFEAMDYILGIRRFPEYPAVPIKEQEMPPGFR